MSLRVSVIIPNRENEKIDKPVSKILANDFDKDNIEIFQITGNNPTAQRNICIKEAKGEIIYFIDNDSEVDINNIKYALALFEKNENTAVVGGPALHIITNKEEEDINLCLSSFFAVGPLAERYSQKTKKPHHGTDKKFILCNLFIRKSVLEEMNYFNEKLYPNEENELIDRISSKGYELIYHPEIVVCRPPRNNVKEYIRMLINYGRGRCEQMKICFMPKNIIFIMPALFSMYIITYIPLLCIFSRVSNVLSMFYGGAIFFYIIPTYAASFLTIFNRKKNKLRSFFIMPAMFFFTHFFYGLGFIYGFIRPFIKKKEEIKARMNKIKSFAK